MIKLANVGYLLVGTSIGAFVTTIIFEKELKKPIGEDVEYISMYDEDGNDISDTSQNWKSNSESGESVSKVSGDKERYSSGNSGSSRDGEGKSGHGSSVGGEFGTDQNNVVHVYGQLEKDIPQSLGKNSFINDAAWKDYETKRRTTREHDRPYNKIYKSETRPSDMIKEVDTKMMDMDSSSDDEVELPEFEQDIHDEYNLEKVEGNFEIFLGDNPQDFVTVIFYEGDNTLCDDGEQIIPYPEDVVGMVALNRLIEGGPGAENGVIFVRNIKTAINYEVVLDAGAYSQTVLGIFESHLNSDGGRSVSS